MPTYRLLRGRHDESIVEKIDPKTNEIIRAGVKKTYAKGDVFFTENNNLERHNVPQQPKFERLSDSDITGQVQDAPEAPISDGLPNLNAMSVAQLKQLATDEAINIDGLSRKADLVEAISESLGSAV